MPCTRSVLQSLLALLRWQHRTYTPWYASKPELTVRRFENYLLSSLTTDGCLPGAREADVQANYVFFHAFEHASSAPLSSHECRREHTFVSHFLSRQISSRVRHSSSAAQGGYKHIVASRLLVRQLTCLCQHITVASLYLLCRTHAFRTAGSHLSVRRPCLTHEICCWSLDCIYS